MNIHIELKLDKKNVKDLVNLKHKIQNRLEARDLIFNNKIQLSELKAIKDINEYINSLELVNCDICCEDTRIDNISNINDLKVCNSCIDKYYLYCEKCSNLIHEDDIKFINDDMYCEKCYFKALQIEYKNHDIKLTKVKVLKRLLKSKRLEVNFNNLKDIDFTINGYTYNIEKSQFGYRLGSWTANQWLDIGNIEYDLLNAIDYHLSYKAYRPIKNLDIHIRRFDTSNII